MARFGKPLEQLQTHPFTPVGGEIKVIFVTASSATDTLYRTVGRRARERRGHEETKTTRRSFTSGLKISTELTDTTDATFCNNA